MSQSQPISRATRSGRNVKKPKRFQSSSSEKELNPDDATTDDDLQSDGSMTDNDAGFELSDHEKTEEQRNHEMNQSIIDMFEDIDEEINKQPIEVTINELQPKTSDETEQDPIDFPENQLYQHSHAYENYSPHSPLDQESTKNPVKPQSKSELPTKNNIFIRSNVIQKPRIPIPMKKNNEKKTENSTVQQVTDNKNEEEKLQPKITVQSPNYSRDFEYQRIENLIAGFKRIEEKQNERMDNLENMIRQREPTINNPPRNNNFGNQNPRPPGFPISSLEQYDAYEDDDNQESQNQLRHYLAQEEAGSSNCKDSIRKFYYHTFSPSIFKKLQWTSHNLKNRPEMRGLYDSKISGVFFDAIHDCQREKQLTSPIFSKYMKAAIEAGKQSLRDSLKRNQPNNSAPRRSCATAIKAKYGRFDNNERADAHDED